MRVQDPFPNQQPGTEDVPQMQSKTVMSNQTKDGGPAFPVPDTHHANGQIQYGTYGMTLRDYFAAKAMAAVTLGACAPGEGFVREQNYYQLARDAYQLADAMLAAREAQS